MNASELNEMIENVNEFEIENEYFMVTHAVVPAFCQ